MNDIVKKYINMQALEKSEIALILKLMDEDLNGKDGTLLAKALDNTDYKLLENIRNYHFTMIDHTGVEGEGSHWHIVYEHKHTNSYWKLVGTWVSYDGLNFYDDNEGFWFEVNPINKMVTFYE